ncbi:hypothetical protein EON65_31535 [archaeon]|nr:MAG: hypothetical protein EON65_31535 [archaeon]
MEGEVCEVIGFNPNKVTRKLLAVEWKKLSEEEQIKVRAARSRRGVKCDICGSAGYYRENCPNSCQSPPRTPDSLATTPPDSPRVDQSPKALFWGSSSSVKSTENQTQHKKALQLKKPVSTDDVRPQAMMNLSTLKQSDEQLGSFGFYKKAGNAYATDYAQLTLHQVMRRMMRLLETHLRHSEEELTARHDSTLLHPPMDRPGKVCYPKEVEAEQEYRDYFINRVLKKDKKLRYKNQASLRPIDDLDPLFRGGDVRDDFLYKTNPNAGESMHAKNTWKSVLARHDILANSDPTLAKKQADLDKLFRNQSKWIANQQKSMMFKNDRFEHMVFILQSELKKEHARSSKMLEGNRKEVRVRKREVWNERLMSVDKLIALLNSYKFAAGLEEADFLMFCLDKWRDVSMREIEAARGEVQEDEEKCEGKPNTAEKVRKANGNRVSNDMIAAATNPYYPDTLFLEEYNKKNAKLHLKSKSGTVYSAAQQREQQASQKIEQLEKLKRYDSKLNARPGSRQQRAFHRHMTLPSLDDMLSTAQKEAEEFAAQDKRKADMLKRYEQMGKQVSADGLVIQRKRRVHPKEKDAQEISKMKKSFRYACNFVYTLLQPLLPTQYVCMRESSVLTFYCCVGWLV